MNSLYASPLRVYLCLGILALIGLFTGRQLPVSLFPNSSKPTTGVYIPFGSHTPHEFRDLYGNTLASQLRSINTDQVEVEKISTDYNESEVIYSIEFKWGSPPKAAMEETRRILNAFSSQLPEEIRTQTGAWPMDRNSGFFMSVFSSSIRSLDELYSLLEPILIPPLSALPDINKPKFYNPSEKEVKILLHPHRMAAFQLLPRDVSESIRQSLSSYSGGSTTIGLQNLSIQIPKRFQTLSDLSSVVLKTPSKQTLSLADVGDVDFDIKTQNSWSFKVSGTPGLILHTRPRPGGNMKKMSEDIQRVVASVLTSLPSDIRQTIIVDPAEFIESAIHNVFHEVALGALLAVLILFIFIGSFKNTITAAIEIPLSMVLAFIPMKLSGMSINLISLGGLALSAGMNVDASVVVMENIFRHFHLHGGPEKGPLKRADQLRILIQAVNEVKWPVISSTLASLVVFLPLAFTSDLAYAVLGDLAKTVVFSHGFSAFVALLLVPTVRLHLMSRSRNLAISPHVSPFEPAIVWIEEHYSRSLAWFLKHASFQKMSYLTLMGLLALLLFAVLPRLPKEIIGKPDTDRLFVNLNTTGNSQLSQMEEIAQETENRILSRFNTEISYTTQESWGANSGGILVRLKDRAQMKRVWKAMEAELPNTSLIRYHVEPWNPGELPIPNPPHLRVVIRGGTPSERAQMTLGLYEFLQEKQAFPRLMTTPSVHRTEQIVLQPRSGQWSQLQLRGISIQPSDLADVVRTFTTGKRVGEVLLEGLKRDVFLQFQGPQGKMTLEEMEAIPIGLGDRIVPLKALHEVKLELAPPSIHQEEEREICLITGFQNETDPTPLGEKRLKQALLWVEEWKQTVLPLFAQGPHRSSQAAPLPLIIIEDARKDLHQAVRQLGIAVGLSISLIFFILLLQFGKWVDSLIVLVAVPLGIIGALTSLFVFRSTLSLNSILGIILLNGIAVANSILLIDFFKQRLQEGLTPLTAALDAGRKRLRPILITSLTTILGMLPVALGLGEGGKILQPLGIAVSGGLWVSMGLTLFIVPALEVSWTQFVQRRSKE